MQQQHLYRTIDLGAFHDGIWSIEQLYKKHGVAIGKGYLEEAMLFAYEKGRLWKEHGIDTQPTFNITEQDYLINAYRLMSIANSLMDYTGDLSERLERLVNNPLSPRHPNRSDSRETLFELEMFARIRRTTSTAMLMDNAGSDMVFTTHCVLAQAECKYINTTCEKTILESIEKACTQIDARRQLYPFGLVALEIESQMPHSSICGLPTAGETYNRLANYSCDWCAQHNTAIQTVLSDFSSVQGYLMLAHTTTLAGAKNCFDVGCMTITNSGMFLPPTHPDMNILKFLAYDLKNASLD